MNHSGLSTHTARRSQPLAGARWMHPIVVILVLLAASAGCKSDPRATGRDHLAAADAYAAQGKLKEATIEYRNALKSIPDLVEAHYKLGLAYLQSDDPTKAYQSFRRAADLDPTHADAHVRAGTLLLVAGEYREARALAERALKSSPAHVDAHILLGNALAGLDSPSRATRAD